MSVVITGVHMPNETTGPLDIIIFKSGEVLWTTSVDTSICKAKKFEKAFELPEHGRLGDLDELEKRFTPDETYYPTEEDRRDYDNGRLMIRDIRSAIKDAPTIIEADWNRRVENV